MSGVEQIFASLLQRTIALPPTQNPFTYFRNELRVLSIYQMQDWWYSSDVLCSGLLVAMLAIRFRTNNLWFFKLSETGYGSILVPNTTSLFAAISVVHAVIMIPGLATMIAGYKEAIGLSIYPYLHMLAWPITVTVVISELHGISVFLYMLQASKAIPQLFGIKIKPIIVTLTFLALYLLSFISIVVPFAIAAVRYPFDYSLVNKLADAIDVAGKDWQAGEPFTINPQWFPIAAEMTDLATVGSKWNQTAWLVLLANIIIVTCLFLPVGFLYARALSSRLRLLQHQTDSHQSGEAQWLRSAYLLMLGELAVILLCSIAYSVISAQWGTQYQTIIRDFGKINATWSILYTIYPVMSFAISSALLFRALQGAKGQGKAGSLFDRTTGTKSRSGFQRSGVQSNNLAVQVCTVEYVEMDDSLARSDKREKDEY